MGEAKFTANRDHIEPDRIEHFYDHSGIEACLRCYADRRCTLDVSIPIQSDALHRTTTELEVWWQPRDAATRLPRGAPLRLLRESLELHIATEPPRAIGHSSLTGITAQHAPECYYRVQNPFTGN